MFKKVLGFAAFAAMTVPLVAPVNAADISIRDPYPVHKYHHSPAHTGHDAHHEYLPACDEPAVLERIGDVFNHYDASHLHTGMMIAGVDGIHQHALKTGGPSRIDRRFCGGIAWFDNGTKSEVVYLIEAKMGYISKTWNVESCLPSYDPQRVYGSWCSSLRP